MKKTILFFLALLFNVPFIKGQNIYSSSFEAKNKATQLTIEAISDSENENYEIAFRKLIESIEIDSTIRETYLRIFQTFRLDPEKSRIEIIIQAINKGKRIFQEDDELSFYCGEIYNYDSIYCKAINEYTDAMKFAQINGEDFYLVPYYYLNRGNIYLKTEKLDLALIDYNYLLKLDSNFIIGFINRGITFYKLGDKEKACDDWKKASENGLEDASNYFEKYCKD